MAGVPFLGVAVLMPQVVAGGALVGNSSFFIWFGLLPWISLCLIAEFPSSWGSGYTRQMSLKKDEVLAPVQLGQAQCKVLLASFSVLLRHNQSWSLWTYLYNIKILGFGLKLCLEILLKCLSKYKGKNCQKTDCTELTLWSCLLRTLLCSRN